MKVGILTLPRVRNWGSFLQAFALKKTVEAYGHDCQFLEIKKHIGLTTPSSLESHVSRDRTLFLKIKKLPQVLFCSLKQELHKYSKIGRYQRKFRKKYENEFLPLLGLESVNNKEDKAFDLVIIGSDQVFNCMHPRTPWGKTLHLFGEGINAKKIITYAASFGFTTIEEIEKHDLKTKIKKALGNVSSISVRDMNSYSIIEKITGKPPELHIDPVLMFDFSCYMPKAVPINNYIIVYTYQQDIIDPAMVRAIKEYAARRKKKIVSLYSHHDWCDQSIIAENPFQLLAYFADADYVFADTFHGVILSIKYNRNFVVLMEDRNVHRVDYLLKQFKLTNRIVRNPTDIEYKFDEGIDFSESNAILLEEARKANSYLKEAMRLQDDR